MQNIPDQIVKAVCVCGALAALLHGQPASAHGTKTETARTERILSLIAEASAVDDLKRRDEKASDLTDYLQEVVKSGHTSAITMRVVQGLGDLLDRPDGRFQVALAIAQVGPRASSLAPKLKIALEEEVQKQKRSLMRQPIDSVDTICTALREIGADEPKVCMERRAD